MFNKKERGSSMIYELSLKEGIAIIGWMFQLHICNVDDVAQICLRAANDN